MASPTPRRRMAAAPSILLIVADDLPRNMLGSYGAQHGLTPHIDSVGSTGLTFERAYTTAPLCTPSRYSLLTGRYASSSTTVSISDARSGVGPIRFNTWLHKEANETLAGRLRQRGYRSGFVGKWHVSRGIERDDGHDAPHDVVRREGGFDHAADVYLGNEELNAYAHQPEWMAREAIHFMHHASQPFLLFMAPTLPHEPVDNIATQLVGEPRLGPPAGGIRAESGSEHAIHLLAEHAAESRALRRRVVAQLVQAGLLCSSEGDGSSVAICPQKRLPASSTMIAPTPWLKTTPESISAKETALVLCAMAWLDATLAGVMQQAAMFGGLLTIFTSDHGAGWAGKGHPYEAGIRVPLLMGGSDALLVSSGGGRVAAPSRVLETVTHLDLLPTLIELARTAVSSLPGARSGAALERPTDGRGLAPLLFPALQHSRTGALNSETEGFAFFVVVGISRTIVTAKWKLVAVPVHDGAHNCTSFQGVPMTSFLAAFARGDKKPKMPLMYDGYRHHAVTYCDPVQLYHREVDPGETCNLAWRCPSTIKALGAMLTRFVRRTEPLARFQVPEPISPSPLAHDACTRLPMPSCA